VAGNDDDDKWKVIDTARKSRVVRMFGTRAILH
jgi:hypothetical protein